jgi:transcriptional regulator of acetoin/glycerol metabolism
MGCVVATRIPPSMTTEMAPKPTRQSSLSARRLTLIHAPSGEPIREASEGENFWNLDRGKLVLGRDPGEEGIGLDDGRVSRRHAELSYDRGHPKVRDLGSKNGSFVNGRRIETAVLEPSSVLRVGNSIFVYSEATVPLGLSLPEVPVGSSLVRAIAEAAADLAAPTELPILIIGPTGVGKELMAQRVHEQSSRKGELVAVNCSTFSRELIGSELFGHTAGAFSGAKTARQGLFSSASGGTLFLDEVAELPLEQQPALLRVLQEGKIRPVGSDREISVNVRIIAATHHEMSALVDRGEFRSDLHARLAGFVIDLPALRERREEIIPLFLSFFGRGCPPVTGDAAEALATYDWPQNVRELKHVAERARLFAKNLDQLDISILPDQVRPSEPPPAQAEEDEPTSKEELVQLLAEHEGNVAKVARALGKHRQQVYRWLKRHEIDATQFRSEE